MFRRQPGLPVLMYHSISDASEAGVSPYYRTATAPAQFERQLHRLASLGWRGVNLRTALDALASGNAARMVALTFDDGFHDFLTGAFPALQRHNFSATMFLPTAFIGDERRQFKSRDCLTWREVIELNAAGIEFGSHTVSHPKLVDLDWPSIRAELRDSRAVIEKRLGAPVHSFAYPYAFPGTDRAFAQRFEQELKEAGYANCGTTEIGCVAAGDNLFRLPRLPVNSLDDDTLLRAKLEGGYDWLAVPQAAFKRVKRSIGSVRKSAARRPTAGAAAN